MEYITFKRFGREEHWAKDKEIFLIKLKELIAELTKNEELYEKADEIEIAKSLKQILKNPKYDECEPLNVFMMHMGLSYDILSKKEKEEIKEMEFTFKNWEKKSEELYNDYLIKSLNSCPEDINFCLEYRYFLMNVLGICQSELTKDNFLPHIRNFFILEQYNYLYEKYMDYKEFNNIRNEVIEIYPKLKETYEGGNRYLEKYFWRFIDKDNDYNYEITEKILDNYYNKKKKNNINDEEKIKLKES